MNAVERDRRAGDSSVDVLWGSTARTSRGPKPSLTRDQIARAGIAIADAEGLAALSMRAVAGRLGFTTMALYRHVPDKTALLAVMIDTAMVDALPLPTRASGWRPRLADWARQNQALFVRHPWLLHAVIPEEMSGPGLFSWIEAGLRIVAETGLSSVQMMDAVFFLYSYVHGMAYVTRSWSDDDAHAWEPSSPLMQRVADDGRFPLFRAVLADETLHQPALDANKADPLADSFEFGLQRALDGIEALIRREVGDAGQRADDPAPGS